MTLTGTLGLSFLNIFSFEPKWTYNPCFGGVYSHLRETGKSR